MPGPRQIASYRIEARLDDSTHTIAAKERIRFTNVTSRATSTVCLHLYLNAFRNTDSTFFRESNWKHRGFDFPDPWGWLEVKTIAVAGGAPVGFTPTGALGHAILPAPLVPGATIELDIGFEARLPRVFARTGWADTDHGRFFMVGQWFPKVGVLTEDGWVCDDFHAAAEFFADFGTYDVTLDVPEGAVVGATGLRVHAASPASSSEPGRVLHRFLAENVHDFAWTSWVGFRERTCVGTHGVEIRLLYPPAHESWAEAHLDVTARAMENFEKRLGPYPYEHITIVDPPFEARDAGGMEYPTLFTTRSLLWSPPGATGLAFGTTIHELGHQWMQGLLASNEAREAYLDEGLTTYVTGKVADDLWGPASSSFDLRFGRMGYFDAVRLHLERPLLDPVLQEAWRFRSMADYRAATYSRTAAAMKTLESVIGEDTVSRGLRLYATRLRWGHPTIDDLVRALSDAAGTDVRWFFDEVLARPGEVDYAIGAIRCERSQKPRGYHASGEGLGSAGAVVVDESGGVDATVWEVEVNVERRGSITLPVPLRFLFEGGSEVRAIWSMEDQRAARVAWKRFTFTSKTPLVLAEVDPDRVIVLDRDRVNDGRILDRSDALTVVRHGSTWLFWVESVLQWVGF